MAWYVFTWVLAWDGQLEATVLKGGVLKGSGNLGWLNLCNGVLLVW